MQDMAVRVTNGGVDLRALSTEARAFARERNYYVGERGSVPRPIIVAYLAARPQRARQVARKIGFTIPGRGRLPYDTVDQLVNNLFQR